MSLDWCIDILKRDIPVYWIRGETEQPQSILRAKGVASQIILTMLMRTNEQQLKRRQIDQLPDLIRLIKSEEKKLPMIDGRLAD